MQDSKGYGSTEMSRDPAASECTDAEPIQLRSAFCETPSHVRQADPEEGQCGTQGESG